MSNTVFVSGASGFIAQHVISKLIAKNYKVIGSVRSEAKGNLLKAIFNSANFSYEIVQDIALAGAFDNALKAHPEITVFLHTASPFTYDTDNIEKDLLIPAIKVTKNALGAIIKYGFNIKHVVVTSSYAAIGTADYEHNLNHINNEDNWNEITPQQALADPRQGYRGSKTFAERAAWKLIKQHLPTFTLTTVNPTFVFGPHVSDTELKESMNTSLQVINSIIRNGPDQNIVPDAYGFVDVRDVADAHLVAFENPKSHGKRLLLNSGRANQQSIIDILNQEFPHLRGKIPKGEPGSGEMVFEGYCKIDASRTIDLVGHDFIGLYQCVTDLARQILKSMQDIDGHL